MNNGELRELVHLLLMCGIMDKTATESGNVTDEEWLRMKNLINKYQTEGGINCEPDKSGDLISRSALKEKLQARHDNGEEDFDNGYNIGIETAMDLIDNAPTVEYTFEDRAQGECKTCRHRDPEDKKCDCGGIERQGCPFPVSDDYFCKFYEKGGAE